MRACLIANRGEIALRIIRACRELGVRACAVYSDSDAQAQHVLEADAAFSLGGSAPAESYLNTAKLLDAAKQMGCDGVHPGYGFLSENADFAQAVIDAGLIWIGPPPSAIHAMGIKTEARALMRDAGVPLAPGFDDDNASDEALQTAANRIGYPIMVKAAGGGGGKGIRIVDTPALLLESVAAARREAGHAFNNARVYLEKYVERARHVEVQVLADQHGGIVHLFERDCSAQRRHQKVIEESPAPNLTRALQAALGAAAVAAAKAVNYQSAGTVEFLLTPDGQFYFLEMNTRLQVEHPVTELVTGHDLVKLQFAVADGEKLPFSQADLSQRGHAIECRLYAEDPASGFLPAPGILSHFEIPHLPGVRVDAGVRAGDIISPYYDPMIAKIIVYDATREAAIRRMDSALSAAVTLGTSTNLNFLRALIQHPAFQKGELDTGFIERHAAELTAPPQSDLHLALLAAALSESVVSKPIQSTTFADSAPDSWDNTDGFRVGGGS